MATVRDIMAEYLKANGYEATKGLAGVTDKMWLDVVDMGLCHLSAAAPGRYTELIAQAHGCVQCVLAGIVPMGRLLAAAVMPTNDEEAE